MYFHYPTFFKLLRLTFTRRYFAPRHAALVILFVIPFLLLRLFVLFMRGLDHLLFPGFREQKVRAPLYIIGNPRSGTTFSHRLLALDEQFTFFKLYHTIFPSVCCYKMFSLWGRVDRILGRPGARLLYLISNRGFKGWETIHKTGPDKAESDEMLFMYAMLSPLLLLLFPFIREMDAATFVDLLPAGTKEKLMRYYVSCLKRHLYATGPEKTLLQKVALIAGRIQTIEEVLPDMRIVHLVRNPAESIPSLISMFEVTWKSLAPHLLADGQTCRDMADLICRYYLHLHEVEQNMGPEKLLRIRYTDLVTDPKKTVYHIYNHFGITMRPEYEQLLTGEMNRARTYKSRHRYSLEQYGLSEAEIRRRLAPIYEEYGF